MNHHLEPPPFSQLRTWQPSCLDNLLNEKSNCFNKGRFHTSGSVTNWFRARFKEVLGVCFLLVRKKVGPQPKHLRRNDGDIGKLVISYDIANLSLQILVPSGPFHLMLVAFFFSCCIHGPSRDWLPELKLEATLPTNPGFNGKWPFYITVKTYNMYNMYNCVTVN